MLSVEYAHGNNPTSRIGPIVIDRAAPSATVRTDTPVFSPDGDGNLDSIEIVQTDATNEEAWTGLFTDSAGEVVRQIEWSGTPSTFVWDGTDNAGNRLEDDVYRYTLSSVDRAGNRFTARVDRLTIDTRATPVAVRISSSAFSPNGDGSRDSLVVTPVLEISENVESWRLDVVDSASNVRRTMSGSGAVPESISFDGVDNNGTMLPEGEFAARLEVRYVNGNTPVASSPVFTIDLTAPRATAEAQASLFSPNGDERKDFVRIRQTGSDEEVWNAAIADEDGTIVRRFTWRDAVPQSVEWNGRDESGRVVTDGAYTYTLSATDRAGNSGGSGDVSLRVDNRSTAISISAAPAAFSPNGDATADAVIFVPTLSLASGIDRYWLEIVDEDGEVVQTREASGQVPRELTWDGRTDSGSRSPDGDYSARLYVEYAKGDLSEARSSAMRLDTTAPQATVRAAQVVFSPEGDGRRDSITIEQETSNEETWRGTISDASGSIVRTLFWSGQAENFVWDGRDENGSVVADGSYRYALTATDRAGNSVSRAITGLRVDTRTTSAFVNPASGAVTPNGDGSRDAVRINLYTSLNEGVERWSLAIVNDSGRVVRTIDSGRSAQVPASVDWDGLVEGRRVVEGSCRAKSTIEYVKGNLVEATSGTAILVDTTGPVFSVAVAPVPFSPDDDGTDDTARISISRVSDASEIAGWRVRVLDPFDQVFYERSGTGVPPATISWDGRSDDGELVQSAEDYDVSVRLTDALGNSAERSVAMPIDVLVIRDGDNLKIRISSIQFAPDSAEFVRGVEPDLADRNIRTLERLAEILMRYSEYQIRIEGHAVSVYWNSPARADSVMATLAGFGIPVSRMTTVGMGGQEPVVPHGDLENRWKNRRVEFILIR